MQQDRYHSALDNRWRPPARRPKNYLHFVEMFHQSDVLICGLAIEAETYPLLLGCSVIVDETEEVIDLPTYEIFDRGWYAYTLELPAQTSRGPQEGYQGGVIFALWSYDHETRLASTDWHPFEQKFKIDHDFDELRFMPYFPLK